MLPPAPDVSAALQIVLTGFLLLAGAVALVRRAASQYFVASFAEGYDAAPEGQRSMSIGGGGGGEPACVVCGEAGTKNCSRCKRARYCSQTCQSKHWEAGHKSKCKQMNALDKVDTSSVNGPSTRRRSSGFGSISLVPARGSCKVLQEPKKILFSYDEFVKLFNWDKQGFPPCGLLNCGNSCFANVVLQCLACTRPLTAYLLERDHSRLCIRKQDDWCFLCELQVHIRRASESLHPFSPLNILSRLPNIGGNLGYGRQEDAHEFMRFAIDTMQSICLDEFGGEKALDPSSRETTLIQYIFGGHLQSQVICTECNMVSNRYENMMDLTVEIQGDAESLEECLDQFTVKEWLDGENMYKCDGCNDYVKAWKRLTVHQAPNILTIALKRFQSGRFGKLNKRVTFPEVLDLTPYMSGNGDGTDLYTLYAVVVHVDMLNASFFGHYICYTKDSSGRWYRIDDCKVIIVEVEEVLAQGAYMLLYSRKIARREPFIKPMEPASKKHSPKMEPVSLTLSNGAIHDSRPPQVTVSDDPQSDVLLHGKTIDASLLAGTGHERESSIIVDTLKETEPEGVVLGAPESSIAVVATQGKGPESMDMDDEVLEVNSMLVRKDLDVHMDDTPVTLQGGKELELENPNPSPWVTEDAASAELVHSDSIAPMKLSTSEVPALRSEVPISTSDSDCQTEENNESVSITEKCTSDNSSSSASITITPLSQPEGPLVYPRRKLEQPAVACKPSDLSNGVVSKDCTSVNGIKESKSLASRQVDNIRRKSRPLFSRGFLNTPARKRSVVHEVRTQTENHVGFATKVNGCTNGRLELGFSQNAVHDTSQSSGDMPGWDASFHPCSFTNKSCGNSSDEDKLVGKGLDKVDHTHCNGSAEWASCQNGSKEYRREVEAVCLNGEKSSSDCERPLLSSHSLDNIPADKSVEFHEEFGGTDIKRNNKGACHAVFENGYNKSSNGCLGNQLEPVNVLCAASLGSPEQFDTLVPSGFISQSRDCERQVLCSHSSDNIPVEESDRSQEELGGTDIEMNNKEACCTILENGFDKSSNICLGNRLEPEDGLHPARLGSLAQFNKSITSVFSSHTIDGERQFLSSNSLNSTPDEESNQSHKELGSDMELNKGTYGTVF